MKIGDRIKRRRLALGYSVEDLAEKLGKHRATIYRYESNEIEKLPVTILNPLAKALKTTPAHLMGWGEEEKNQYNKVKAVKIPVLGNIAAGLPMAAIEDYTTEEWEEIPAEWIQSAEYFALKIKGSSMEPKFSEGDVVIVKKQSDIESGDIGVVIVNGEDATVKKVVKQKNGVMLIANNQTVYQPKFYSNSEIKTLPVKIIGKVVELRAKF